MTTLTYEQNKQYNQMLQKLNTSQQRYRNRKSISQQHNDKVSHRKLYSRDRSHSFVKPKIRSNSHLKIFQYSEELIRRKRTDVSEEKNPFRRCTPEQLSAHKKVIATEADHKQHEFCQIDISKLSSKYIRAEKKKRIQNVFSRSNKPGMTQETGIDQLSYETDIKYQEAKKENHSSNMHYGSPNGKQERIGLDVEEMHYYMVSHQHKIKKLSVN